MLFSPLPPTPRSQALARLDTILRKTQASARGGDLRIVRARLHLLDALCTLREALADASRPAGERVYPPHVPIRLCRCEGAVNDRCPIHRVDHAFRNGCCSEPEDRHRHAREEELETSVTTTFERNVIQGKVRYYLARHEDDEGSAIEFVRCRPETEEIAGPSIDLPGDLVVALAEAFGEAERTLRKRGAWIS